MGKLIIFDWSGVIKDALTAHLWVINRIFCNHNLPEISLEEFYDNWTEPYMKFYNKYFPTMTIEEEQKEYREAMSDSEYPHSTCVVGMKEVLETLKTAGDKMVIVSADFPDALNAEIRVFGLESTFDEVITGVSNKGDTVGEILAKHAGDKGSTFIVGDSVHEIEVGKKWGIKTVAVTWGFGSRDSIELMAPDKICENVNELKSYLLTN